MAAVSHEGMLFGPNGLQHEQSSNAQYPLGTRMRLQDGREFVYVLNGAVALTPGKLIQSPVPGANYDELAVPAAVAVGARAFNITTGATAVTKDQFKDGYVIIEDDAGEGHLYGISGNDAIGTTANGEIRLKAGEGIQVALTTSTTVGLLLNPYSGVIIHPSPPTALVVGVTPTDIAASVYGWLQTKGPAAVLIDGTVIIGQQVVPSDAVDGAVEPADSAITDGTPPTGHGELMNVGRVIEVAADTEHGAIMLSLP